LTPAIFDEFGWTVVESPLVIRCPACRHEGTPTASGRCFSCRRSLEQEIVGARLARKLGTPQNANEPYVSPLPAVNVRQQLIEAAGEREDYHD
jgi:hypothetical protein